MMNYTASEISEEILKCLKLSNLNYVISEKPFSVEIKIKKSFVKEFPAPQDSFQTKVKTLMNNITSSSSTQSSMKIPAKSSPIYPAQMKQSQNQKRDPPANISMSSENFTNLPPMNLNPPLPMYYNSNYPGSNINLVEASLVMKQKSNRLPNTNLASTQLNENHSTSPDLRNFPTSLNFPKNYSSFILTNSTNHNPMNSQSIKPLKLQPPAPSTTASLASPKSPCGQRTPTRGSPPSRREPACPTPPSSPPGFPVPTSPSIFQEERFDTYKNFTLEEFLYLMKIVND